jgi:hypothetical protein
MDTTTQSQGKLPLQLPREASAQRRDRKKPKKAESLPSDRVGLSRPKVIDGTGSFVNALASRTDRWLQSPRARIAKLKPRCEAVPSAKRPICCMAGAC